MNDLVKADIAIIGAGAGGLSVAAGAAQMGAKVVLIENEKMGGDCLNYGCVPSKSLLAAAKMAKTMREAERFGIPASDPHIEMAKVMAKVHGVIDTLSSHDSVERFEGLGVNVIKAAASFESPRLIKAGHTLIQARRYVIATGSSPAIPPIPGLDTTPYYTNETIFELTENPTHLIIIGGGPIGCELAQAFLWLGIKVTLLEGLHILPRDEADLVDILRESLIKQGLTLYETIQVQAVKSKAGGIEVTIMTDGKSQIIEGSHLLVATGRRPNLHDLHLEAGKIDYTSKGIQVDAHLRTSNRRVYAIGDVVGPYQFTHVANYHAGIVLRRILFRLPAKVNYDAIPWVTYTHPELAHVGLSSAQALTKDPLAKVLTWDFADNDRAQTEHDTLGKIKLITSRKGQVLGVSILGPHAGELITPWVNMIREQRSVRAMTDTITPYPTLSEINKQVAGTYYTPLLFSKRTRLLVRLLSLLG